MRITLAMATVVALASGCTSENDLRFMSTLENDTNGVVLSRDGLDAHAGMFGMTCTIDTSWGCPVTDTDLPTEDERVVDHVNTTTLAVSSEGLHIIRDTAWRSDEDVAISAVRSAKLLDNATLMVVGTTDSCALQSTDGQTLTVPGAACAEEAEYAFDKSTQTVFAATGDSVVRMAFEGAETVAQFGDLVSFDASNGLIYVGEEGGTKVTALRDNGAEVWSVDVEGTLTSLAARGSLGQVVTLSRTEDGVGVVSRFSGSNGDQLADTRIPRGDGEIVISSNGRTVADVREDEVNFYGIDADVDEEVVDDTPPQCIDPLAQATRD